MRQRLQSMSRNTPFDGWKLKGRAVRTIVGGKNGLAAVASARVVDDPGANRVFTGPRLRSEHGHATAATERITRLTAGNVILEMRDRGVCVEMTHFTRSPIEITPRNFSPSITGKCRMRFSVIMPQTFLHRLARSDDRQLARHDLAHLSFARTFSAQHHFARVIALGNHSDKPSFSITMSAPTFLLRHHLDRFETLASGETEKISLPFWPRIASIVPLTSMIRRALLVAANPPRVEAKIASSPSPPGNVSLRPESGPSREDEIEFALLGREMRRGSGPMETATRARCAGRVRSGLAGRNTERRANCDADNEFCIFSWRHHETGGRT